MFRHLGNQYWKLRKKHLGPIPNQRICRNGHDTDILGRASLNRCVACLKANTKRFRKNNPDKFKFWQRRNSLKKLYGIDINEYNRIFQIQGGRCAICKKHQSQLSKNLAIDHCHKTSSIRGLLCQKCNLDLGIYEKLDKKCIEDYLNRIRLGVA